MNSNNTGIRRGPNKIVQNNNTKVLNDFKKMELENQIEQYKLEHNILTQFNDEIKETKNEIISQDTDKLIKDTFYLKNFVKERIQNAIMRNLLLQSNKNKHITNLSISSNI